MPPIDATKSDIGADKVYSAEIVAIEERRKAAWTQSDEALPPYNWKKQEPGGKDFVGLALSGGGIRAASLGLGVL